MATSGGQHFSNKNDDWAETHCEMHGDYAWSILSWLMIVVMVIMMVVKMMVVMN